MSTYLVINDKLPTQVASVKGWGDFIRWVDSLPSSYIELANLVEFGWCQKPATVHDELGRAKKPSDANTKDIINNLMSLIEDLLDGTDVILITDGSSKSP